VNRRVLDRLCAVLAVVVLTAFAFLLVTGHYVADGPVLLSVSAEHGLHEGDLLVAAGWAAGVAAVVRLLLRRR
jgi:signal peptidase I